MADDQYREQCPARLGLGCYVVLLVMWIVISLPVLTIMERETSGGRQDLQCNISIPFGDRLFPGEFYNWSHVYTTRYVLCASS